jgi:rubrerythrin
LEKLLVEKITACAEQRKIGVGELIKKATRRWLDEGLLEDHEPLFLSDRHETVNGKDTKLPHKTIFKQWLEAKTKAEQKIQQMIDSGEVETRTITDNIFGVERKHETILGKSLYQLKGDLKFIADYKSQAEAFIPVGTLFNLIKRCGLIEEYALLLGYKDIFTRLSRIYEVTLTDKVDIYLESIRHDIKMLNGSLGFIKDKFGSEAYILYDCRYFMDVPQASFAFDPDRIEPEKKGLKIYYDDFEKTLGDEFRRRSQISQDEL